MKTLHGLLEKVMWVPDDPRVTFGRETYTLPAGSNDQAVRWLVLAASFDRLPVTLEVDDEGVIWRATVKVEECSVAFSLPNGTLTFSG